MPPETTRAAVCRSGRSLRAADTDTKRVDWGSGTSIAGVSTGAAPPCGAAGNDATRTVATIWRPAGASTVAMALPA